jgi:hypothetical protein
MKASRPDYLTEEEWGLLDQDTFGNGKPRQGPVPLNRGAQAIGEEKKPVIYVPAPFEPRDPSTFPRRYGRHYARKFVSMTVAPGDVGKTTLTLTEAVAMAANMPLLGVRFRQAYRVWYWNGEDPREEIDRRVLGDLRASQDQSAELGRKPVPR